MYSQVKPMRSSAPGPKFSTMTSDSLIIFSSTALPSGFLVSRVSERLLLLSMVKYSASASGTVAQLAAGHVAGAGTLDLDHVGAEPGQQLGAGRAGLNVGEVDDLDALEGKVVGHVAVAPCGWSGACGGNARRVRACAYFDSAAAGFRLVIRPLSVPAVSSMTALIRVGLRRTCHALLPWRVRSSAGVVALTPTPPKALHQLVVTCALDEHGRGHIGAHRSGSRRCRLYTPLLFMMTMQTGRL